MSRLVVKNLPKDIKEERFRKIFADFGSLTDCKLKFTKDGRFRQFGFVGYQTQEEAQAALRHFHKSFIDTSKLLVEMCKPFGDPLSQRKRASKVGFPMGATMDKRHETCADLAKVPGKKKDVPWSEQVKDLEELSKNDAFQEFLAVHKSRRLGNIWSNDNCTVARPQKVPGMAGPQDGIDEELVRKEELLKDKEAALNERLSDMDYLHSKVVEMGKSGLSLKGCGAHGQEENQQADNLGASERGQNGRDCLAWKDGTANGNDDGGKEEKGDCENVKMNRKANIKEIDRLPEAVFTVKLSGLPYKVTKKQIHEFLHPEKPTTIRMMQNTHGKFTGVLFADFESEKSLQGALKRDHDYIGRRYVRVSRVETEFNPGSKEQEQVNAGWQRRNLAEDEQEEDVADSGRIFVRNLSYSTTETDLDELFCTIGPLAEVKYPVDPFTKKPKGFAFVTFVFPEHAVKACSKLDGSILQGRLLHILPSTVKVDRPEEQEHAASSSYKKQKEARDKANSSSSHNWNTLFIGANALADAIAAKYNTPKSQVLDDDGHGSIAVRLALGETQIVQETRRFLLNNGVQLDCFSQAAGRRSNTVILVKNLPSGTAVYDLHTLFGRFGDIGRLVLPPAGVSALVEFLEPLKAKAAFSCLAYSKFQHLPLFLEWAPIDVFQIPATQPVKSTDTLEESKIEQKGMIGGVAEAEGGDADDGPPTRASNDSEDEVDTEDEDRTGCTLFVKNLNFKTTDETLNKKFSICGLLKSCTVSKKKHKSGSNTNWRHVQEPGTPRIRFKQNQQERFNCHSPSGATRSRNQRTAVRSSKKL
uniref:RNA binding motif protein 19 n=1 Tax=Eptatretus burgeri TaxID=7764 RepID=A0A8C4QD01_EPTBU